MISDICVCLSAFDLYDNWMECIFLHDLWFGVWYSDVVITYVYRYMLLCVTMYIYILAYDARWLWYYRYVDNDSATVLTMESGLGFEITYLSDKGHWYGVNCTSVKNRQP